MDKLKYALGFVCALALALPASAFAESSSLWSTNNGKADREHRYEGRDGKTYTERDFKDHMMKLYGFEYGSRAHFYWTKPAGYFDGYALYVTEGNFRSGLENYSPVYLGKDVQTYTFPTIFSTRTKVSAHLYAYIELKNGAKKFIQPGRREHVMVRRFVPTPTPLPTPVPEPPPAPSVCGTETGDDGIYHVCLGDRIIHVGSSSTLTLKAGTGSMVNLEVSDVGTFSMNKNAARLIVETKSGEVLELRLSPATQSNTYMLSVLTLTQFKKGDNSTAVDGNQFMFVGDSFTHVSSGVSVSLDWYQKDESEQLHLSFSGSAEIKEAILRKGSSVLLTSNSGVDVRVTLLDLSLATRTVIVLVETVPKPELCGDKRGGDGVYSLCVGDDLFHESTGMNIKVLYYLRLARFAHLQITGTATSSVYLSYWFPVTVETSAGKKLKVSYEPQTNETHLYVKLETIQ